MNFINGLVVSIVLLAYVTLLFDFIAMRGPCESAGGVYVSGFMEGYCVRKEAMIKLEEGAE